MSQFNARQTRFTPEENRFIFKLNLFFYKLNRFFCEQSQFFFKQNRFPGGLKWGRRFQDIRQTTLGRCACRQAHNRRGRVRNAAKPAGRKKGPNMPGPLITQRRPRGGGAPRRSGGGARRAPTGLSALPPVLRDWPAPPPLPGSPRSRITG